MTTDRSCFLIQSDMNTWINICVVVEPYEDFQKVKDVALTAYYNWFEDEETDETITDYIKRHLNEKNLSYLIFTGPFNEDSID